MRSCDTVKKEPTGHDVRTDAEVANELDAAVIRVHDCGDQTGRQLAGLKRFRVAMKAELKELEALRLMCSRI